MELSAHREKRFLAVSESLAPSAPSVGWPFQCSFEFKGGQCSRDREREFAIAGGVGVCGVELALFCIEEGLAIPILGR